MKLLLIFTVIALDFCCTSSMNTACANELDGKTTVNKKSFFYDKNGKRKNSYILPGDIIVVKRTDGDKAYITYEPDAVDGIIPKENIVRKVVNISTTVKGKSFFYKKSGKGFKKTSSYIIKGDVVSIIEIGYSFSKIRYENPKTLKTYIYWVKSKLLNKPENSIDNSVG